MNSSQLDCFQPCVSDPKQVTKVSHHSEGYISTVERYPDRAENTCTVTMHSEVGGDLQERVAGGRSRLTSASFRTGLGAFPLFRNHVHSWNAPKGKDDSFQDAPCRQRVEAILESVLCVLDRHA